MRVMNQRLVRRLLLALALLCVQQGALLHELSHVVDRYGSKGSLPTHEDSACEKCVSFAPFAAAADAVAVVFVAAAAPQIAPAPVPVRSRSGRELPHYLTRAPPVLV